MGKGEKLVSITRSAFGFIRVADVVICESVVLSRLNYIIFEKAKKRKSVNSSLVGRPSLKSATNQPTSFGFGRRTRRDLLYGYHVSEASGCIFASKASMRNFQGLEKIYVGLFASGFPSFIARVAQFVLRCLCNYCPFNLFNEARLTRAPIEPLFIAISSIAMPLEK